MKQCLWFSILAILIANSSVANETSSEEIDRTVWSVVSSTVVAHDIDGMAATYHPDGVFVSTKGTAAISDQLAKWGKGMEDYKAAGTNAKVAFRFKTRQDGESTAFEAGMFKYTEVDSAGEETSVYVPFEALLVKKDGRWLMVMERQFEAVDEAVWGGM